MPSREPASRQKLETNMAKKSTGDTRDSQASWPSPNPALQDLAVLIGEWDMELSGAAFLPSPSDVVKGSIFFSWVEDGAFLEMRQGARPPSPPAAVWLIGRDETTGEYQVVYYDSRGVSRIYTMSFENGLWKIWRDAPGFLQRYEGAISPDGNTIKARWEKSSDGQRWEHDFDLTYTRVR